jgi:hypothetical protein
MTFLELAQNLRRECGIAGSGPAAVTGQTGELSRLVEWVKQAWFEIQSLHRDWKFLRLSASWTTVADQYAYTLTDCGITSFGQWVKECGNFRCYLTATGVSDEQYLNEMSYEALRNVWLFASNRNVSQRPTDIAIMPNDGIALGPKPTAGYTITGDYYRAPVTLSADSDTPALPAKHDPMIIVYKAMMKYARFKSAPEVYAQAKEGYAPLLSSLRKDQLPELTWGGPLA